MNNDPINLKPVVNQAVWRDVTDDYAERSFVFANTEFQLNATSFSVDANGNRYINGLKITPNDDNFDFNGGSSISDFVNAFIEPASDPSGGAYDKTKVPNGIGRTVDIKFTDTNLIPTIVKYGEAAYSLDLDVMNAWTYIDWTLPLFASYYVGQGIGMYQSFWDSGITKFLDTEGRPILYGTVKADQLHPDAQS